MEKVIGPFEADPREELAALRAALIRALSASRFISDGDLVEALAKSLRDADAAKLAVYRASDMIDSAISIPSGLDTLEARLAWVLAMASMAQR